MSVIEDNWNFFINNNKEIENKHFIEFELGINNLCESVLKSLEDGFLSYFFNQNMNLTPSYDDELKLLIEGNNELRQEIDSKLEKLTLKLVHYESIKKDKELLFQEIKETHDAFLMAKKYYKKFLKIYFSIESKNNDQQVVFIQFFTEVKKDTDNYSVKLVRNLKTSQYELQSVTPMLKHFKELQKKLSENNDVPGVLCSIRQAFLNIKKNKSLPSYLTV